MTPTVRKAIYGVIAAGLALAVVLQLIDETTSAKLLETADQILAALALVLAFRNVDTKNASNQSGGSW